MWTTWGSFQLHVQAQVQHIIYIYFLKKILIHFRNGGIYMGECGAVDGSWCVDGNNYTSGEMRKVQNFWY